MAWGFAGVMGPMLGARVFVSTGAYQYAFFGSAGLACAALVILSWCEPRSLWLLRQHRPWPLERRRDELELFRQASSAAR